MMAYVLFTVSMTVAFVLASIVSFGLMAFVFTRKRVFHWYMRKVLKMTSSMEDLVEELEEESA